MTTVTGAAMAVLTALGIGMAVWGSWLIGVELRGWVERQREYAEMRKRLDLVAAIERHPASQGWQRLMSEDEWPR